MLNQSIICWKKPEQEMPDADTTVLLRLANDEDPVAIGFWDGEFWCEQDGTLMNPKSCPIKTEIKGWMHLHEAAEILDSCGAQ